MESELLQLIVVFVVGLISGALIMLLWNKLSSGSAAPGGLKQEYQDYQEKVETHFEETSKKFQDMTAQYQDLYKHLSVGATSLCRPDSVAAVLADESPAPVRIEKKEKPVDAGAEKQQKKPEQKKEGEPKAAAQANSKEAKAAQDKKVVQEKKAAQAKATQGKKESADSGKKA